MPIQKGGTKSKRVSNTIKELMKDKPGKTRAKAISTIAKKQGITRAQARQRQAVAIALQNRDER